MSADSPPSSAPSTLSAVEVPVTGFGLTWAECATDVQALVSDVSWTTTELVVVRPPASLSVTVRVPKPALFPYTTLFRSVLVPLSLKPTAEGPPLDHV